ncbi:MAG TPA: glycosyltransferase family 4 protein [Pyrinomonadaceae bacterium]|nr:glycosyltransferase family 4 protein [Pyrinomonadaceae bacterium]
MASGDTNQKRRLWVVSELYYPEETSTGYYLTRIAEGLTDEFDVKVICGQPTYSARGTVAPGHEFHKGVEIFRAAGTTLDKNVIVFRLLNMLTLGLSVFFKALTKFRRGDRVLVVTTPPNLPFVVAIASLTRGAAYTLVIHDNYPEILVATEKTTGNSFLFSTLSFFNRWLYKHATKIIVVGRDMRELVAKKTDGLDVPIATIPNWAELESVSPADRADNELLKELELTDKLVFLYAGNMGHPNDLTTIVDAAEMLRDVSDIHFVFLGAGVKRRWLEKRVGELELSNVTILAPRPRSEQKVFLNACDVALVSLVGKMVGVSMPSRTYNILAVGKPILALTEPGSEVSRVVEEDEVGWTVQPGDSKAFADTVLKILERRSELRLIGAAARKSALEKYSLDTALEKYRREL